MIDPTDKQTAALPLEEQPVKRGRGRPATGKAMTPAEKQRAYRERLKAKQAEQNSWGMAEALRLDVLRLEKELAEAKAEIRKLEASSQKAGNVTDNKCVIEVKRKGSRKWEEFGDDGGVIESWELAEKIVKDCLKTIKNESVYRIKPIGMQIKEYR